MTRKSLQLQDWQTDESVLKTERVQVWGDTMRGLVSNADARQMIRNGSHFVISSQAIGAIESHL